MSQELDTLILDLRAAHSPRLRTSQNPGQRHRTLQGGGGKRGGSPRPPGLWATQQWDPPCGIPGFGGLIKPEEVNLGRAHRAQRRTELWAPQPHALLLPCGSSREGAGRESPPDPRLTSVPDASLAVPLEGQLARLPENTHLARDL